MNRYIVSDCKDFLPLIIEYVEFSQDNRGSHKTDTTKIKINQYRNKKEFFHDLPWIVRRHEQSQFLNYLRCQYCERSKEFCLCPFLRINYRYSRLSHYKYVQIYLKMIFDV